MKIGFIGLGAMGRGMAHNLLINGHAVSVYDQSEAVLQEFERQHPNAKLRIANSCYDVANGANVLICMLPTTDHTDDALFGAHGAASALEADSIVMDMGTGSPTKLLAIGKKLATMQLHLIDAPVNRAPPEAQNGTLLAMVGGEDKWINKAMPLLECMCDTIHRMGALGTGIHMKLANNYMSMINLLLTAEGLLLAERAGIDRAQAVAIMSAEGNGASNGQLLTIFPRKVLAGDLTPDFPLSMCLKDISLAMELGVSLGLSLNLGAVARNQFALAKSWQREQQDCTAILPMLHEINASALPKLSI